MTTVYTKVPAGHWFDVTPDFPGGKGSATGCIYPPYKKQRKTWRITYAICTGDTEHMQGKSQEFNTLAACKHQIHLQFAYF